MQAQIDKIKSTYETYINDPKYVYKSCQEEWIVILQKLDDTKTNEARAGTRINDIKYAKCRANKLVVVLIFNKFDCEKTTQTITNSVYNPGAIEYNVNSIVIPNIYDEYIHTVCTNGIHYYLSIEPAFYLELPPLYDEINVYCRWDTDGGKYINGKKTGHWT